MSALQGCGPPDRIAESIGNLRGKGVRLWAQNGQLHYRAPPGVISKEEVEHLKADKNEIVAFLESRRAVETFTREITRRLPSDYAPLTLAQFVHWRFFDLDKYPAIRQVASAVQITGALELATLERSLVAVLQRHEALRTRIVVRDGTPMQHITASVNCGLRVRDLSDLPDERREAEVNRWIDDTILEPIDVSMDPLVALRLLKLDSAKHVLVIAIEHIVADAFSLGIFVKDLFAAYGQLARRESVSLPAIPVQLADYACWQSSAYPRWLDRGGSQWLRELAVCKAMLFPREPSPEGAFRLGWEAVPVRIGRALREKLRCWCRLRRTTIPMAVFTAYAGLVLRWCGTSRYVIRYQSDGRAHPEVERTVGLFASQLYVCVEIEERDRFMDFADRLTDAYCSAYEHADFSESAVSLMPRPDFTRNANFNWVQQSPRLDGSGSGNPAQSISICPHRFTHPMLKNQHPTLKNRAGESEPSMLLQDAGDEIVGDLYFPSSHFSKEMMERFARNFLLFTTALCGEHGGRVLDIELC